MNGKTDELVMRLALQPLIEREIAEFDKLNKRGFPTSDEFNLKVKRVINGAKIRRGFKSFAVFCKYAAVAIMIACTVLTVACALIKPLREGIINAVFTWYEEKVTVKIETEPTKTVIKKEPTYIPKGYTEIERKVYDEDLRLEYQNSDGDLLFFKRYPDGVVDKMHFSQQYVPKNVRVGKAEGIYFDGEGERYNVLLWSESGYLYILDGIIGENELIKIAENLK